MDRKILYLLERYASTVEDVTFVHIPGHSYDLSNLEVDKMARQELEREYLETIPKKMAPFQQIEIMPELRGKEEENRGSTEPESCQCRYQKKMTENRFGRFIKENTDNIIRNIETTKDEMKQYLDETCEILVKLDNSCLLYTSPSPRDRTRSRMPSSA